MADQEGLPGAEASLAVSTETPTQVAQVDEPRVFRLRSFPVVYRWNVGKAEQSGEVNGVKYQQTMGRMVLMYPLIDDLDEEDFKVKMSCWQIEVSRTGGSKDGKIPALCQETYDDIHRDLSWWKVDTLPTSERFLIIYLAKANHRQWAGPWYGGALNPHKKGHFGWSDQQGAKKILKELKITSEELKNIEPGEPEDWNHEISTAMTPEQICTGIDMSQSDKDIRLVIHLNEEALDGATARIPLEEVFAADISANEFWVFLRGDSFTLCRGLLAQLVRPELTTWQVRSERRRKLPEGCNIKSPAFFNPALVITMVKETRGSQEKVFEDFQHCNYGMPKDRIDWSERIQRCMVLLPGSPNNKVGKASRAQALVTKVESKQDLLLNRVILLFHLEDRLPKLCENHRVHMHDLFTLMIGERNVQLNFVADSEYAMCWGVLGGACVPHSASMEIFMDATDGEEHPVLKLGLVKAPSSRGRWDEVFTQMKPWQVSQAMLEECKREHVELAIEDEEQND